MRGKKSKQFLTGFTLVELIVAATVLAIAVAGVFATFSSAVKLSWTYRHEVMAAMAAHSQLEFERARQAYPANEGNWDLFLINDDPNPGIIDPQWLVDWANFVWDALRQEVAATSLSVRGEVRNGNYSANGTDNPEFSFRRITVTARWREREP
ncbi:MAG: prepilin-type N-terminal cleavage/methylation domain-containing protein [Candidatus Omnitrophota bacterium]